MNQRYGFAISFSDAVGFVEAVVNPVFEGVLGDEVSAAYLYLGKVFAFDKGAGLVDAHAQSF